MKHLIATVVLAIMVAGIYAATCNTRSAEASAVTASKLGATSGGQICVTYGAYAGTCNLVAQSSDEFNGTSLDQTKWFIDQEIATATFFGAPYWPFCAVPENVVVGGGSLQLTISNNNRANCPTGWDAQAVPVDASTNVDIGLIVQRAANAIGPYVTVEVRMRFASEPSGLGTAMWSIGPLCACPDSGMFGAVATHACGCNWPHAGPGLEAGNGEFDFVETEGVQFPAPTQISHSILNGSNGWITQPQYGANPDPSLNYHIYTTDWLPGEDHFYIDGVNVGNHLDAGWNVFNYPLSLIFSVWPELAGNPEGLPAYDAATLPQTAHVDWIRIFTHPAGTPPAYGGDGGVPTIASVEPKLFVNGDIVTVRGTNFSAGSATVTVGGVSGMAMVFGGTQCAGSNADECGTFTAAGLTTSSANLALTVTNGVGTSSAVNVRVPFTPAECPIHYVASPATAYISGGRSGGMIDSTFTAEDTIYQPEWFYEPIWQTSAFSTPSLDFVNKFFDQTTLPTQASGVQVVVVADTPSIASATPQILVASHAGGVTMGYVSGNLYVNSGIVLQAAAAPGAHLLFARTGTSGSLFQDGVSLTTGSAGTNAFSGGITVGAQAGVGDYAATDLEFVALCTTALTPLSGDGANLLAASQSLWGTP